MRLGWLVNNFANPHVRLTIQQRRDTLRLAHKRYGKRWYTPLVFLSGFLPVFSLLVLPTALQAWLASLLGVSKSNVMWILVGFLLLGNWLWMMWVNARLYTKPFRRALRDRGVRVCVGCGYLLDGIEQPGVCPECGAQEPSDGGASESAS